MTGFLLGMAMLVSSGAGAPPVETPPAAIVLPAYSFEGSDAATAPLPSPWRLADEQLRPVWQRGPAAAQDTPAKKRFSTTDRVIAVAAGVAVGWVVGGAIGYKLTQRTDVYDDGVSGLRGVVIGAPIGAAAGAILGWRITK